MKAFRVELKVCEACGTLWLRTAGQGVYCRRCSVWLSEFPAPRGRGGQFGGRAGARRGRKPLVQRPAVAAAGLQVVYRRGASR